MPTVEVTLQVSADGRPRGAAQTYQLTGPAVRPFAQTIASVGGTWAVAATEGIRVIQGLVLTCTQAALVTWNGGDAFSGGIQVNGGGAIVLLGTAIDAPVQLFVANQGSGENRLRGVLVGLP